MDLEPNDSSPEGPGDYPAMSRLMAGLMLLGALTMVYVCADILCGGSITRAVSGRAPEGDDA